jgi:carboxylesterase type B
MAVKRHLSRSGFLLYFLCVTQIKLESKLQRRKLSPRIITTRLGKYRGVIVDFPSQSSLRDLDGYIGIHYSGLINNSDRFAVPRRLPGHEDIEDVFHSKPPCPYNDRKTQYDNVVNGNVRKRFSMNSKVLAEDCLFLNIYAPVQGKQGPPETEWIF